MRLSYLFGIVILTSTSLVAQITVTSADGVDVLVDDTSKIITLGGSITETVHALGNWDAVIATDESSTYPPQVFRMPRVPYLRNMTSEGVLSLESSLIIASSDAGPESVIEQIRDANTPIILIQESNSLEGVLNKIEVIGKVLGKEEIASQIIEENRRKYEHSIQLKAKLERTPKVMFVLETRNGGSFMVAGAETGAATMIELAGAENAFNSFTGYKPVSNESILTANPDFVIVFESRLERISNGLNNTPAVNLITAVKNEAIIPIDGNLFVGFGPRFGEAILTLMSELHPEIGDEF